MLEGIGWAKAEGHRLVLAELLRVRGMVLAGQRRWDEADHAFDEAVSTARSVRYPYVEARALYEWGLMYARGSDPHRGRGLLEEAAEIFRRLDARPYSELVKEAVPRPG